MARFTPKMIFGSRWIIPEPDNAEDLILILQKSHAVPLPYTGNVADSNKYKK